MPELLQLPEFLSVTKSLNQLQLEALANTLQSCLLLGGLHSGWVTPFTPNKLLKISGWTYEPTWVLNESHAWCIMIESNLFDWLEIELLNLNLYPEQGNVFLPLGLKHEKLHSILQEHQNKS